MLAYLRSYHGHLWVPDPARVSIAALVVACAGLGGMVAALLPAPALDWVLSWTPFTGEFTLRPTTAVRVVLASTGLVLVLGGAGLSLLLAPPAP